MKSPWKTAMIGIAVFSGASVGLSRAPVAEAAIQTTTSHLRSGPVYVSGQVWRNVPYVTSGGTTYFGIWYLQQLLKQYGIASTWDGRSLGLPELPTYQDQGLHVNGNPLAQSTVMSYGGDVYVNLQNLATSLGGTSHYAAASKTLALSVPASYVLPAAPATSRKPMTPSHATGAQGAHPIPRSSAVHPATLDPGGRVVEDGAAWRTVPILYSNGTSFFGVWYLQQFLKSHGIDSQWDGQSLSIQSLPSVTSGITVTAGSVSTESVTAIQTGSAWYVPVSALSAFGWTVSVDPVSHSVNVWTAGQAGAAVSGTLTAADGSPTTGELAFQNADGSVQTVSTNASGSYQTQLKSPAGTLMGVDTAATGWVSEAAPVAGAATHVDAQAAYQTSTIHGHLVFSGASVSIREISIRNAITHAHYYAEPAADNTFSLTVPSGVYEVYALVTADNAIYLVHPFATTGDSTSLTVSVPVLPTGGSVDTPHAVIAAGDAAVTPADLVSASNLFRHVYGETVRAMGVAPDAKMNITLYGTAQSYEQHFLNEGYTQGEAQSLANNSVAAEEGPNVISVLLPEFQQVDGLNILAHEFTHALVSKLSLQIESWANEGIAWSNGIAAEIDNSPDTVLRDGIQWQEWTDIIAHQKAGDLQPLGQADPLSTAYNVEDQDYFAVHQLISQYGMSKFIQYIGAIDHDPNAFQDTFGESFSAFSASVTSALQQLANATDTGFTVRLKVLPGGPSSAYVIDPNGNQHWISGLKPGTYDIVCNNDGSISAPSGLTVSDGGQADVLDSGKWYVGCGGDVENRQEFEIGHEYGITDLIQALLYDSNGQIVHAYPATAVPNGLQLLQLTTNH